MPMDPERLQLLATSMEYQPRPGEREIFRKPPSNGHLLRNHQQTEEEGSP